MSGVRGPAARPTAAPREQRPTHIVIVGHDDHDSSRVAAALARRLQRPLLDRTPRNVPHEPTSTEVDHDGADTDALEWYSRTIRTAVESVIAAPTCLLDENDPPTRPDAVWTVVLEDGSPAGGRVAADDRRRLRSEVAGRLCDVQVDASCQDTERIVDDIAREWAHRLASTTDTATIRTATETEHHHVR